jgi:hypothetical protein
MKLRGIVGLLFLALISLPASVAPAGSSDLSQRAIVAALSGIQEVPAVITQGTGRFRATLDRDTLVIDYEVELQNLEGALQQVNLRIGQAGVDGEIAAILCGGGGASACPATGGFSGTLLPADVLGNSQGVGPGEIGALMDAISAGAAYVNVETSLFQTGEIRGQLGLRVRRASGGATR